MGWTQPICERCWIERNSEKDDEAEGESYRIRMPTRILDPEPEVCCYCGLVTIVGIFTRADPKLVPFPRQET